MSIGVQVQREQQRVFACLCLSLHARVCVYSKCLCVHACVYVSSYFRHSHHGHLFLVLKDFVCMHMSMGICTHRPYVCVRVMYACVFVCVLAADRRAGLGGCGEFVCSGPLV